MIQPSTISLKQIGQGFIGLAVLILFVWLAFYALIFLLILSAAATVFLVIRNFLRQQGILKNKTASGPYKDSPEVPSATVIETEYRDVTEEKKDVTD